MNPMTEVLLFCTFIGPIVMAFVEVVKRAVPTPKNFIPVVAIIVGLVVGFLAEPLYHLGLTYRLWGGVISALIGTGLYEVIKQRDGYSREEEDNAFTKK
jgi:hypothetical protein